MLHQASLNVQMVAICPRPTLAPHWHTASAWTRTSPCIVPRQTRADAPRKAHAPMAGRRAAPTAAPLAASRRRSRRCGVRVGCAPVRPRARAAAHPARRVGLTSLTARRQSLMLSDCVGRSCPQTRAREGLARRSTIAAPGLTPPQKSPPPPPTQSPGRPESPREDTGGAAADSPCAPTPPASHPAP